MVARYWQLLVLLSQVHILRVNLCNARMNVPALANLFSMLKLYWFKLLRENCGQNSLTQVRVMWTQLIVQHLFKKRKSKKKVC